MKFFIDGLPVAQARPKFARFGNHVKAYDPEKSKNWKAYVAMVAASKGVRIQEGPLRLSLSFHFVKPKSAKKRVHHIVKPDLDNLIKGVKDALKGIAWMDDSQVVALGAFKSYSENPGVWVEIMEQVENF